MTIFHELKHFHDSILNPMLYSLYGINVSEDYLRWAVIDAMREDTSLTVDFAIREINGEEYFQRLSTAKNQYLEKFGSHQQPIVREIGNTSYSFSIQTFFELSAFVHEVIAVIFLAGEEAARSYIKYKRKYSDPLYTHIFQIFLEAKENIHKAIDTSLTFFDVALIREK